MSQRIDPSISSRYEEPDPYITPGIYEMKLMNHETRTFYGSKRLVLTLSICTIGEFFEVQLKRFYNVRDFIGKAGPKGKFYPKTKGDFLMEYYKLLPGRVPRLDRIPMQPLYNPMIIGRVVTVKSNNQGKPYPPEMYYSKVGELIGVKE